MDLAFAVRHLWEQKLLVLLAAVLAAILALVLTFQVSLMPPRLHNKGIEYANAKTTLLVDAEQSPLADTEADIQPLVQRAQVLAASFTSYPLRIQIASELGVPLDDVAVTTLGAGSSREPAAAERSSQLSAEGAKFQVTYLPTPDTPVITVFAQAPTVALATRLADAAGAAARDYVHNQVVRTTARPDRVVVRQVARSVGGVVNPGANIQAAIAIGLVAFAFVLFALLTIRRVIIDVARLRIAPEDRAAGSVAG